jgi:hypothetical protein
MARTMLDEHRTPRRYWAEAVNTACHVGNQIFLRAFLNKTCYVLMHGRAPRVSYFRAFGCRCFILKKRRLDKFESRSLLVDIGPEGWTPTQQSLELTPFLRPY